MADENEVKALAARMSDLYWDTPAVNVWEIIAREALRWRDETRPVQAPPAALSTPAAWATDAPEAKDRTQQAPPAAVADAEPVAWQYRFATPDGLTWSDWQPIQSEAMARQMVDTFGKMVTRAEWRSLKVFEWGGYAGECTEADFAGERVEVGRE